MSFLYFIFNNNVLIFQQYLKSRLNCLVVRDEIDLDDFIPVVERPAKKRKAPKVDEDEEEEVEVDKIIKTSNTKVAHTDNDWAALTL